MKLYIFLSNNKEKDTQIWNKSESEREERDRMRGKESGENIMSMPCDEATFLSLLCSLSDACLCRWIYNPNICILNISSAVSNTAVGAGAVWNLLLASHPCVESRSTTAYLPTCPRCQNTFHFNFTTLTSYKVRSSSFAPLTLRKPLELPRKFF